MKTPAGVFLRTGKEQGQLYIGHFGKIFKNQIYNDDVLTTHELLHILILETEVYTMATTNLNIRINKDIKDQAEQIFNELGLNMTTAINMFLRTTVRENGIPFSLKLDVPNEVTAAAIEEGRRIASDRTVKGYTSMDALKAALDE